MKKRYIIFPGLICSYLLVLYFIKPTFLGKHEPYLFIWGLILAVTPAFYCVLKDQKKLKKEIDARTAKLEVSKTQLKEETIRNRKRKNTHILAGGLAHDFNNVLCGITGNLSLLQYKIDEGDVPLDFLKSFTKLLSCSAEQAAALVQQLQSLKDSRNAEILDLNKVIKRIYHTTRNNFDKSIEIHYTLTPSPALIQADPGEIEQAILILCINKARNMTTMRTEGQTRGGHLSLTLEGVDTREAGLNPQKDTPWWWKLEIQDSTAPLFYTTMPGEKETELTIAANIVHPYRGHMKIQSGRITLYFPALKDQVKKERGTSRIPLPRDEEIILVVDDQEITRNTATEMLKEAGYQVLTAENGKQGVQLFRTQGKAVDLVLLDLGMPVMSGEETYKQIREIDPGASIILTSGNEDDPRVKRLLASGIKEFLRKPFTFRELMERVQKVRGLPQEGQQE